MTNNGSTHSFFSFYAFIGVDFKEVTVAVFRFCGISGSGSIRVLGGTWFLLWLISMNYKIPSFLNVTFFEQILFNENL